MSKTFERILDFNQKPISLIHADGQWWVAIRPICDALEVDYHSQFKNLQEDAILAQLLSKQTTVAADGKLREMTCLPEKYVYGWLFSIRSDSPALIEYKRECYDVLFAHFHGMLAQRVGILREIAETQTEIAVLREKLQDSPDFKRLTELGGRIPLLQKNSRSLDRDLLTGQAALQF